LSQRFTEVIYAWGERRWSILKKKEEGEKIKLKYDERKKFLYKPQSVIVYIICIVVSTFPSLYRSFYLY
jgi:hypothetical protein